MSRKHEDTHGSFSPDSFNCAEDPIAFSPSLLCEAFIRDYATGSPVREIGKITWTGRDRGEAGRRGETGVARS